MTVGLALLALAGALGSCSDDDGGGAGRPAELSKAELKEYCEQAERAETFPFPQLGNQSPDEQRATLQTYARELKSATEKAAEAAPAAVKADLETDAKALAEVAEAGDLTKRGRRHGRRRPGPTPSTWTTAAGDGSPPRGSSTASPGFPPW